MTALAVIGLFAAGVVAYIIGTYNSLVSLREQVLNAFKQIDVQLKRRYDLIPNLIASVKGYMEFEKDTLEAVISARNQAINVQAGDMKAMAEKEGMLTQALTRFMAVVERYPDLKANENVKPLMEQLTTTENQLGFARQFYNDLATRFNIMQEVFPSNLIANNFGFTRSELFELPEGAAERQTPAVDLSIRPKA